jgi:excisionase family DNA binding protein
MTSKQVQQYLKISHQTLLNLRRAGLAYIKLGKKVLFRRSDIDSFLEQRLIVHPHATMERPPKPPQKGRKQR